MTKMSREAFLEAAKIDRWATVEEIVQALDTAGYWDEEYTQAAVAQRKKTHIRAKMRSLKDADGWPIYASVTTKDEQGNEIHVYKAEMLFDRDDYLQTVNYHAGVARHHASMATGYRDRAEARYNMQIPLPDMFPNRVTAGD